MKTPKLICQGYETDIRTDHLPTIKIECILNIPTHATNELAEALKTIHLILTGGIELVKSEPGVARCFYCATKNGTNEKICSQCGATL